MNLSGSYVALITPFHPDGSVNFEKLAELCEWHVQNGTDGIVALADELTDPDEIEVSDEAQAVVAFRVESFSTFTITWQGSDWFRGFKINVNYVNSLGEPIDATQENFKIKAGDTVEFEDYAKKASTSLKYVGAYLNSLNGEEVATMKANETDWGITTTHSLIFQKKMEM